MQDTHENEMFPSTQAKYLKRAHRITMHWNCFKHSGKNVLGMVKRKVAKDQNC